MLKGVNNAQGKPYFQGKDAEVVRGMTSMMGDDKKIIEYFDQANFSHSPFNQAMCFLKTFVCCW